MGRSKGVNKMKELLDYLNKEIYPYLDKAQLKKIKDVGLSSELVNKILEFKNREVLIRLEEERRILSNQFYSMQETIKRFRSENGERSRYKENSVID